MTGALGHTVASAREANPNWVAFALYGDVAERLKAAVC